MYPATERRCRLSLSLLMNVTHNTYVVTNRPLSYISVFFDYNIQLIRQIKPFLLFGTNFSTSKTQQHLREREAKQKNAYR